MPLTEAQSIDLQRLLELDAYPRTVWEWLQTCVITKNEATGKMEPFPTGPRWDYLQYLTSIRRNYRIFAVEKSRRMLVTWWLCSVYLYDTLTQANHANFIVSKKLTDSAYLLGEERILGVYQRIPAEVWPHKPRLEETGKEGRGFTLLTCPDTGSYIQAVASGADQLRQYTATNVLLDEYAFQEKQEECWAAVTPTILGGGHVDMVSTPELGAYMHDLLYDLGRA